VDKRYRHLSAADLRGNLNKIFDEAGPDYELDRVVSLEGTKAEKLAEIRAMNAALGEKRAQEAAARVAVASGSYESGSPWPGDSRPSGSTADPSSVRPARSGVRTLADAVRAAKFDVRNRPAVTIPPGEFFAAWTLPTEADFPPRLLPDVAGKIADRRYLFPFLEQAELGSNLAIHDFQQTVETVTGTIERAPSATGTKATYQGTVVSVVSAAKQVALVATDVPAAIVEALPAFNAWLERELGQRIGRAVDDHVKTAILAATPAVTNKGGDPLFDAIRKAVTAMANAGAAPRLVAMNPTDSETLDLARTADGIYLRGLSSTNNGPLWDLSVIETPSIAALGAGAGPLVIDPALLGVLYMGPSQFKADPFTGMRSNLVDFLLEMNLKFHVRNIVGAREIRA
jgi:hypothetical protein